MLHLIRGSLLVATFATLSLPAFAADSRERQTDTLLVRHPEIVISATRTPRNQMNIPNATAVVTGDELRARGTRTLAEALQDVVGLDTGEGSDNGSRLPNVGLWGLKEFDALLFTLDGVPVGGPFNPSLSQIPIEEVDRIEVVKGPQGTLYGVSAFAGMIQTFTGQHEVQRGHASVGAASFGTGHGDLDFSRALAPSRDLGLHAGFQRSEGWQDRTEITSGRGDLTVGFGLLGGRMAITAMGYRDRQDWGTPLPFDAGQPLPGFETNRNYAVGGAIVQHEVFSALSRYSQPWGTRHRFENTFSFTHDEQRFARSFPDSVNGDFVRSVGVELEPAEATIYEDVRAVFNLRGAGAHELVTGAALTHGEIRGKASEFRFNQNLSVYPNTTSLNQVTRTDERDFEDGRNFLGVYAHDAWTPVWRLTLEGGGRFDAVEEELETEVDLPGGPQRVKDKRDDIDVSGDLSTLLRLIPEGRAGLQTANVYASVRRGFKPAAPNLAEAEAAEILAPERTVSWETGVKSRAFDQVAFEASYFDMTFRNMVVSIAGPGGAPELTSAGKERFRGFETQIVWDPKALPGTALSVGYAHHEARFVHFTFFTPDGQFRDVSGKHLELVPRDLVNARASVRTRWGSGGFVAVRYQGERPLNRRNTFFADPYTEWDAGISYDRDHWLVTAQGRNLGDDRHVTSESEIGDSQFYVAPPRRFAVELSYQF